MNMTTATRRLVKKCPAIDGAAFRKFYLSARVRGERLCEEAAQDGPPSLRSRLTRLIRRDDVKPAVTREAESILEIINTVARFEWFEKAGGRFDYLF